MHLFVFMLFKKNPLAPPQAKVNLSRAFVSRNYHQSNKNVVLLPTFCFIFPFMHFFSEKMVIQKAKKNTITFEKSVFY